MDDGEYLTITQYKELAHRTAMGIDAINEYAELQLQEADLLEAEDPDTAEDIRAVWIPVLEVLMGPVRAVLAADLMMHMVPEHFEA